MIARTPRGLPDTEEEPGKVDLLFVGAALASTERIFAKRGTIHCEHAATPTDAIERMMQRGREDAFDCVMVDMRHREDGCVMNVVAIAALEITSTLVVLCQPEHVETFRALIGVHRVIEAPIVPKAITNAISAAVERRRRRLQRSLALAVQLQRTIEREIVTTTPDHEPKDQQVPEPSPVAAEKDASTGTNTVHDDIDIEELAKFSAQEAKKHVAGISTASQKLNNFSPPQKTVEHLSTEAEEARQVPGPVSETEAVTSASSPETGADKARGLYTLTEQGGQSISSHISPFQRLKS